MVQKLVIAKTAKELSTSEPSNFKNYLRIDNNAFNLLLELVRYKTDRNN